MPANAQTRRLAEMHTKGGPVPRSANEGWPTRLQDPSRIWGMEADPRASHVTSARSLALGEEGVSFAITPGYECPTHVLSELRPSPLRTCFIRVGL